MADDFGFGDDFDDLNDFDDDDPGDVNVTEETGEAALLCFRATATLMHTRTTFYDTLDAALDAAEEPCTLDGCLGVHSIAARDPDGTLRVVPTGPVDIDGLRERMRTASRQYRERENARNCRRYQAQLYRLGITTPSPAEEGHTDVH